MSNNQSRDAGKMGSRTLRIVSILIVLSISIGGILTTTQILLKYGDTRLQQIEFQGVRSVRATDHSDDTDDYRRGLSILEPLSNQVLERKGLTNETHIPLCNREEIQNGAWLPTSLEQPPYVTRTTHLRCYPLEAYKKGPWNTYKWQPLSAPNCEFTNWSRGKFCSLMERVTIMIAGDSLSWEHFSSLAQLLGQKVSQFDQHKSKLEQRNHIQYGCKDKVRIVYRRDDRLTNLTEAINATFPQVLVLNRGAHYVHDTRLLPEIYHNIEEINNWKRRCDVMGVACHFFWRTSVPGHPKCDKVNFTEPVNDLTQMERWIADKSNYDNRTIQYHWFDYKRQNELVEQALRERLEFEHDILDAYHLNIRRPDEHRSHQQDCLHNCYPGKMDVYNQLMLHFLKIRRSRNDVATLVEMFNQYNAMERSTN